MKVITSKRIAHRTEVILLENEQKIIVRMKKEQYERFPRIAPIRTDIPSEVIERVQTQDPDYKDFGDVFEYVFENVEQGSYYLFIEPLFLL
jgi:protein-tyrosine-phosphatase